MFDDRAAEEPTSIPQQPIAQSASTTVVQPCKEAALQETGSASVDNKPRSNQIPARVAPQQQNLIVEKSNTRNREEQLSQMVDDLVGPDDDDVVLPPTPPSQALEPVPAFSENGKSPGYGVRSGSLVNGTSPRGLPPVRTPDLRAPNDGWHFNSPIGMSSQRLQSVSNLWNDSLPQNSSPRSPYNSGPSRIPSSASIYPASVHSRVNSGNSIRSPVMHSHGYDSFDPTPQPAPARNDRFASFQGPTAAAGQYLMFGAGSSPWSTEPRRSLPNITPPNGQGG